MVEGDQGKILKFPLRSKENQECKCDNGVTDLNIEGNIECQNVKILEKMEGMIFAALRKGAMDQAIYIGEILFSFDYQLNIKRLVEALSLGYVNIVRQYIGDAISSALCEKCTVPHGNCDACKATVDNIYFSIISYYIKNLELLKQPIPRVDDDIIEVLKEEKGNLSMIRMQELIGDANISNTSLAKRIIETILTGELKQVK